MTDETILKVRRIGIEQLGMIRTFNLFIDGSRSKDIGIGDSVDIELPPGRHSVYVQMDSVRSNTLDLELRPATVTELTVELIEDLSPSFFRWVLSAVTQFVFGLGFDSTKLRLNEATPRKEG